MKFLFISILLLFVTSVVCYLGEKNAPFTVSVDKTELKRGDTVHITWTLSPGLRFPLYGYASARTSKTDLGLLVPDSPRTELYSYTVSADVSVLDYTYIWTIDEHVPTGKYQIGIGFFYHEVSPIINIT
ncbi:hypothetical protein EDC94DRAFT_647094 [Helicostylum pulchrum]|nr:hypothetical protein EDC94DRAFT_647094 [Helicostylum pulchrum]